jgi:hypothetical protein
MRENLQPIEAALDAVDGGMLQVLQDLLRAHGVLPSAFLADKLKLRVALAIV